MPNTCAFADIFCNGSLDGTQILDQIAKGKLKDAAYPFVDTAVRERPQEVFVFIVGGCTYEEAAAVAAFNAANECEFCFCFFLFFSFFFFLPPSLCPPCLSLPRFCGVACLCSGCAGILVLVSEKRHFYSPWAFTLDDEED